MSEATTAKPTEYTMEMAREDGYTAVDGIIERDSDRQGSHPPADAGGQAGGREGTALERGRVADPNGSTGRSVPTVASWFTGVGGIDIGFQRAGFELVSVSEIEEFQSAVLATHCPDVPNLGDITEVVERVTAHTYPSGERWQHADVWVGGFPCQDLSQAGGRAGLHDEDGNLTRSGLALAFLRLAEEFLPRWIILENVYGLLSSNGGRDLQRLGAEMAQLGYGWSFRVLNSAGFGVPQRRRRVFIVATLGDPSGERAAEVLALRESQDRYRREGAAPRQDDGPAPVTGVDIAGALTVRYAKGINTTIDDGAVVLGTETPDAAGSGEAARVSGWLDNPIRRELAAETTAFRKVHRSIDVNDPETWEEAKVANTINTFDAGERDTHVVLQSQDEFNEQYNPEGYDTKRWKSMGNAVTVNVAEWLAHRLMERL